jgi:hypothetical protein
MPTIQVDNPMFDCCAMPFISPTMFIPIVKFCFVIFFKDPRPLHLQVVEFLCHNSPINITTLNSHISLMPITRYSFMLCSQIVHWFIHQSNYHNNSSFRTSTIQIHDWERLFHTKIKTFHSFKSAPQISNSSCVILNHHSRTMPSYI